MLLPLLGETELAVRLEAEADQLKRRFNEEFWMPHKEYFALALDKDITGSNWDFGPWTLPVVRYCGQGEGSSVSR